jgi:hypothetical protein
MVSIGPQGHHDHPSRDSRLRRRFGENFRPQLELEYIERLLRDF